MSRRAERYFERRRNRDMFVGGFGLGFATAVLACIPIVFRWFG